MDLERWCLLLIQRTRFWFPAQHPNGRVQPSVTRVLADTVSFGLLGTRHSFGTQTTQTQKIKQILKKKNYLRIDYDATDWGAPNSDLEMNPLFVHLSQAYAFLPTRVSLLGVFTFLFLSYR